MRARRSSSASVTAFSFEDDGLGRLRDGPARQVNWSTTAVTPSTTTTTMMMMTMMMTTREILSVARRVEMRAATAAAAREKYLEVMAMQGVRCSRGSAQEQPQKLVRYAQVLNRSTSWTRVRPRELRPSPHFDA